MPLLSESKRGLPFTRCGIGEADGVITNESFPNRLGLSRTHSLSKQSYTRAIRLQHFIPIGRVVGN